MRILVMFVTTLLFTPTSHAQAHPEWLNDALKVDNPNELAYWSAINSECPLTGEELDSIVKGVLLRSRIKPLEDQILEAGTVYLNVSVQCTSVVADNKHAYYIRAEFGRYNPPPPVLFDAPVYRVGIGDKDFIKQNCEDVVESAVTLFIKANLNMPVGLLHEY
jgi:hypothetical protein